MSYQLFYILTYILLGLCGAMLLISVLLFFRFRITRVIGELSGRTAKKQIAQFRQGSLQTGSKKPGPGVGNLFRGKTTGSIPASTTSRRRLGVSGRMAQTAPSEDVGRYAAVMHSQASPAVAVKYHSPEPADTTEKLGGATDVLSGATDILANGTDVLSDGTDVLGSDTVVLAQAERSIADTAMNVHKSIIIVHTDEAIDT